MPIRYLICRVDGSGSVALGHRALNGHRAYDRVDDASEFGKDAVTRGVLDPPAVSLDQRQDRGLVSSEGSNGRHLVLFHQTAIAGDVGCQNGGQSAFHLHVRLLARPVTTERLALRRLAANVGSSQGWRWCAAGPGHVKDGERWYGP